MCKKFKPQSQVVDYSCEMMAPTATLATGSNNARTKQSVHGQAKARTYLIGW